MGLWSKLLPGFFDDDERTIFAGIGNAVEFLPPEVGSIQDIS